MPLVLTYECPKCKKVRKELHVINERHEACPHVKVGTGPFWVLKEVDVEG